MLEPAEFAGFFGFTEDEVKELCRKRTVGFAEIKTWYDGYDFEPIGSVYNPYSVMRALRSGKCKAYWRKTSAAGFLADIVNRDVDGLEEIIARLIANEQITVNVDGFQNDFETFTSADDVLTLLIHLGYLTYHENGSVQIPNEEIRGEFREFLRRREFSNGWH